MSKKIIWKGKAWALVGRAKLPPCGVGMKEYQKHMPRVFRTRDEARDKRLWYETIHRVRVVVEDV